MMKIEIVKAGVEDKSVLRNMMELYLYDFSEYDGADLNQHGLFEYEYIDHYWTEPERQAFFLKVEGKLAGFALIREVESGEGFSYYSMAEFFVMRKYRRQNLGKIFAHRLFDLFPGHWRVAQEDNNHPSQVFWRKVISEYTLGSYRELHTDDWQGPIQEFDTSRKGEVRQE
jgi:predicted acetyltransferase